MKGILERTAVEYTYEFPVEITAKLNNQYHPTFLKSLSDLLSNLTEVELINITNHFVVFIIDLQVIESDVDVKPIANGVRKIIEDHTEKFFSHDS